VALALAPAVAAAGVAGAAGCDDPDGPPGTGATPSADPDTALVDGVLTDLRAAARAASRAGLTGWAALHRVHIEALQGDPPRMAAGAAQGVDPAAVLRREQQLQQRLVEAAVAAESGVLARLLASMSAAVGQRLVDFPGAAT
jgi:hypothetical protein